MQNIVKVTWKYCERNTFQIKLVKKKKPKKKKRMNLFQKT